MPTDAPSLLELDQGFVAMGRRLRASPWFTSLRADERWIVAEMLFRARYSEAGEFWFAGKRLALKPGQFIDSEEEIARAAGSTRKTVRTVFRKAIAAGLVSRARVHPSGQCPSITTVLDYDRIRFAGGAAGQRTDAPPGQERAEDGPELGQRRAPSEQGNPVEPREPLGPQEDSSVRPSRASARARVKGTGAGETGSPPAALPPRETANDAPRRPGLQVLDLVELGPLGAVFRAEAESALEHGLVLGGVDREQLESDLATSGSVDRALGFVLATARTNHADPVSVHYLAKILHAGIESQLLARGAA